MSADLQVFGVIYELTYRKPPPWMTIDELLDKLLFLAVSDDGMAVRTV